MPLSDEDIRRFTKKLLAKKQELEDLLVLSSEAIAPVTLDQTSVGRLSRMDALQAQAMAQENERRRKSEIQKINSALQRIEEGEYGYCIRTGEEIPRERLELDPAAPTIVPPASR